MLAQASHESKLAGGCKTFVGSHWFPFMWLNVGFMTWGTHYLSFQREQRCLCMSIKYHLQLLFASTFNSEQSSWINHRWASEVQTGYPCYFTEWALSSSWQRCIRKDQGHLTFIYISTGWDYWAGRMDVRKAEHSCQHLCWLVNWSPDACCGLSGCLSWQSHAGAPGCRGTWRPWGQRWSTPQLEPGTGLACCHPVEKNHNMVTPLSIHKISFHIIHCYNAIFL